MRPLWGIERLGTLPTVCHPPSGYMRCESDRVVFDRNLCKARHLMKRLLAPLLFVLTLLAVVPAQAHGGGWHGGGYGYGYGHHGGGYRNGWVAPVLGLVLEVELSYFYFIVIDYCQSQNPLVMLLIQTLSYYG